MVVVLPFERSTTMLFAGKEEVTEADLAGEPLVWHGDPSTQPTKRPLPNAGYPVRGVDEGPSPEAWTPFAMRQRSA
ncbi:hypothetical protein ACFVHS_41665 [Streptomyces sp. NPDC057746]|uniref:hypothetical protein n=1 Tax=Streptomyces sp. NPDC057746 TaxID=3346237 RepID=UPI0036C686F5